MSQMTNYLENKIVDLLFRNQAFAAPANLHISLHTANPGETGASELASTGGYVRAAIASNLNNWRSTNGTTGSVSSGTTGQTSNATAANFPTPTANWGTVTHFAIWDASTGGNCLLYGALTVTKTINQGDSVSFADGALVATFD